MAHNSLIGISVGCVREGQRAHSQDSVQAEYMSDRDFTQLIHSVRSRYPPVACLFSQSNFPLVSPSVSPVFAFLTHLLSPDCFKEP